MAKDTFWFPHDFEPTSDPKITALIGEYGGLGYGIYWRIVEMLHSSEGNKLPKKKYIYASIAKQLLTDVQHISTVVEYATNTCELFSDDDKFIWSCRVLRNIERMRINSEQHSIAGKASAKIRAERALTTVQQPSTDVQQPSTYVQHRENRENKEDKENRESASTVSGEKNHLNGNAVNGKSTPTPFLVFEFLKTLWNNTNYLKKIIQLRPKANQDLVNDEIILFVKNLEKEDESLHPKNERQTLGRFEKFMLSKHSSIPR